MRNQKQEVIQATEYV